MNSSNGKVWWCPICGGPCPVARDTIGKMLHSEYAECSQGHWSYEFAHGTYRETVGDQTWMWCYTSDPDWQKRGEEIRDAKDALRHSLGDKPWRLTAEESALIAREPGTHVWFEHKGVVSCKVCVMCRRADGKNPPCKGKPAVTLRGEALMRFLADEKAGQPKRSHNQKEA